MARRRLIIIGLDAYEISLAESMMAAGDLPNMQLLADSSVIFDLDHGYAKATGLAWEHISTGCAPGAGGRWSAVTFNPETYMVNQETTRSTPIFAKLNRNLLVFDAPYFDLRSTHAVGITSWGAHDPGVDAQASPPELARELDERFGPYVGKRWIYGFTWPSKQQTIDAGNALVAAVRQRAAAVAWLLSERFKNWDAALIAVSEPHSAIEQFWHGIDPMHPLHNLPSAKPAGEALRRLYVAIDAFIGNIRILFPDADILLFSMHGMGQNEGDVPAMVLLPELMYRLAFGRAYSRTPAWRKTTENGTPLLEPDQDWHNEVLNLLPPPPSNLLNHVTTPTGHRIIANFGTLGWMPAVRYQPFWRFMPAFAFPAFYDGQIRINVKGRERHGIIAVERFEEARNQIIATLKQTRCLITNKEAVKKIWYPSNGPLERGNSEPDIFIEWQNGVVGFKHPKAGVIGPYPYRRTGGHTGERGFAWLTSSRADRERKWRSSFDIVPTIFDLLEEPIPTGISGMSLL